MTAYRIVPDGDNGWFAVQKRTWFVFWSFWVTIATVRGINAARYIMNVIKSNNRWAVEVS